METAYNCCTFYWGLPIIKQVSVGYSAFKAQPIIRDSAEQHCPNKLLYQEGTMAPRAPWNAGRAYPLHSFMAYLLLYTVDQSPSTGWCVGTEARVLPSANLPPPHLE